RMPARAINVRIAVSTRKGDTPAEASGLIAHRRALIRWGNRSTVVAGCRANAASRRSPFQKPVVNERSPTVGRHERGHHTWYQAQVLFGPNLAKTELASGAVTGTQLVDQTFR